MTPLIPQPTQRPEYLSLAELEALAFANPGFPIVAAHGVEGPEWQLRVPEDGREKLYRAHREAEAVSGR